MKKCPTCNATYSDDSMSFCLEDGAPLLTVGGTDAPSGGFDPNLTIPFTPPRDTSEPRSDPYRTPSDQWGGQPAGGPASGQFGQQPGGGYGQSGSSQYGGPQSGQFPPPQSNQYQPAPSWTPQPPPSYAAAPKKSSALPWVLGGVGLLVVLGVVAAVLIGVLASMSAKNANNSNNSNNSNSTANRSNRNSNSSNANNSNSTANSSATPTVRDDFSNQKWWTGTVSVGSATYSGGEYRLSGAVTGGYIAVYGPNTNDYHTENARVVVTARSVTGASPSLGYGLAVYGEMKNNQLEDYSLLIRTDPSNPSYRVVLHKDGKETTLVNWTSSSVIRTGTSPNQLEVRTSGKQLNFYINGQYVTNVTDTANYGAGLVGLYTSDTYEVAFDDLEIYK